MGHLSSILERESCAVGAVGGGGHRGAARGAGCLLTTSPGGGEQAVCYPAVTCTRTSTGGWSYGVSVAIVSAAP
jgi:hypothetical protein